MIPRRWLIFGLLNSLFVLSMLYRTSSAVIAPDLSRDLSLDYHDLGLLGGMFFYAFALVQLPIGAVLDRFGARRSMTGLNLLAAVGAIVFALAGGLTGGLIGRAMLGLGMAANLMGGFVIIARWFEPGRFATLTGLYIGLGTVGSLLSASPLALAAQWFGWRSVFVVLGLLTAALAVGLWVWVSDYPPGQEPSRADRAGQSGNWANFKLLMASRDYWAISLAAFARYGAYAAIQALWVGPFLIERLSLDPVTAGNLLLGLNIGFVVGAPLGGVVSDRWLNSRKRTVGVSLLGLAAIIFGLSVWPQAGPLALLGALLFGMGMAGAFGNVIYAQIKEIMPEGMSGLALTGINFFAMLGAGVFMHGLGGVLTWLSEGAGGTDYRTAFQICAAAVGLGLLIYLLSRDTKPREQG